MVAMLRFVWLPILMSFTGCIGGYCEDPRTVVSAASTEPGSLRVGVEFRAYGMSIAALHDGSAVCLTCSAALTLDQQLHSTGGTDASKPLQVAVAPDDTVYFLDRPPENNVPRVDVVAYEPGGGVRWRTRFDDSLGDLVASADAAYVTHEAGGPPLIFALDAATGESRQLPIAPQFLLGAAREGIFTGEGQTVSDTVTLHHVGPTGAVLWSRTLTSSNGFIQVARAVPSPDDGGIFIANASKPVDFGDYQTGDATGPQFGLVFELDATGATQWAFTVPTAYLGNMALTRDGQIVLTGGTVMPTGNHQFLALATSTGILRSHDFDGTAYVSGLAAGADGLAWLQMTVEAGEDDPPPVLHIAGHTFTDDSTYLFGIVL